MQCIEAFDILPVIELDVYKFSDKGYESPSGSISENAEEWDAYHLKYLADAGLRHFKPAIPGEKLMALTELDTHDLSITIDVQLTAHADENDDGPVAFNGGLLIMAGKEALTAPQCCTNIHNYHNWEEVIKNQSSEWEMLWIGHPWIYARVKESWLELTGYLETEPEEGLDAHARYAFDLPAFRAKLQTAQAQIQAFQDRLALILQGKGVAEYQLVANQLVEGVQDE